MVGNDSNNVQIWFDPISNNVCLFIITDKQWLLENVFCLVSNAIKFVTEGSIVIRLTYDDYCANENNSNSNEITFLTSEVEDTGIGIPCVLCEVYSNIYIYIFP